MGFFAKTKQRASAFGAALKTHLHNDRLKRADVLLAHRIVARRRSPTLRQWHLVGRVLTQSEKRIIKVAGYAVLAGLLLISLRWTLMHAALAPASGGEYREGIVGSVRAVNPILAGGNDVDQDIAHLVYSGLYRRDADAQLALDLAQSVDISSDGKTYTFILKPGVKFHDGQAVTANDVVFTVNTIMDPAWKSPLAKGLQGVTALARDPQTVVISSSVPNAYLPSLLTFGILPEHIWKNVDPKTASSGSFNLKPVGSGPFEFEKFSRDGSGNITSYTLHSAPGSGAMLDRITFKFYGDYGSAADALSGNIVDGLNFVPPTERDSIGSVPNMVMHASALSQYTALFLNQKNDPALADVSVRQALAFGIDRDRIIKNALNGLGALRDAPIADDAPGVVHYPYDPKAAAALLDKAGYVIDPETKIRTKTETQKPASKNQQPTTKTSELTVTITTVDTDENKRAAAIIKDSWTALGIKTDIITAPAASINTSVIRPREYDALLMGEVLALDADPYPFWHSSQTVSGQNLAMYSNRLVDELLEKARIAATKADRDALLDQFQQIITTDEPAIFLYQPDYLYPQSSKISGYDVRSVTAPADRFANVTMWYRKLKLIFK